MGDAVSAVGMIAAALGLCVVTWKLAPRLLSDDPFGVKSPGCLFAPISLVSMLLMVLVADALMPSNIVMIVALAIVFYGQTVVLIVVSNRLVTARRERNARNKDRNPYGPF